MAITTNSSISVKPRRMLSSPFYTAGTPRRRSGPSVRMRYIRLVSDNTCLRKKPGGLASRAR